jgi:hypothetical protein
MEETGLDNHATANASTDAPPRTGLQAPLRAAYHLILSGWEVRDAAAWLGVRPERVRRACPCDIAPPAA